MEHNRNKPRFEANYEKGKSSEEKYLPHLEDIFECKLNHDGNQFASFDFYNDDIMVELKDRDASLSLTEKNGQEALEHINGRYLYTLWFDYPKMRYFNKHRKEKKFYIVWRLKDDVYVVWKVNRHRVKNGFTKWYVESQYKDHGKGYDQDRDVVNVYLETCDNIYYMDPIEDFIPSSLHKQDSGC
jgi:hypothetical protein